MNYYPKYSYLDQIVSSSGKDKITLFIDLKSCMQSLYQEWAVRYIIDQSRGTRQVDCSMFGSLLEFISWHKNYAKKRGLGISFFVFLESGKSGYHTNIEPRYKANRKLTDFFGLDSDTKELFFNVMDKNYNVIEKVCNKLPDVTCIRLRYLEADFIPWYTVKNLNVMDEDQVGVIYSTDKDMLQCLDDGKMYQFYRHYKNHKILSGKDVFDHYFKDTLEWNYDPEYIALILAIVGDTADGIEGIKGIGDKTIKKVLPEIIESCGSMEDICKKVLNKEKLFENLGTNKNKPLEKIAANEDIVTRNLKLTSYRILSDHVSNSIDYVERVKTIGDTVSNKRKIVNGEVLNEALSKLGLHGMMSEDAVFNIF